MDEQQRRLVYRYLIARVGLRKAELPPLAALDHQMKNGFQVVAGGVLIDRTTNQPIIGDEQDPAFFAAIVKGDLDATDIDWKDLEQTRRFVLHDKGSLPPPFGRETSGNKRTAPLDKIRHGKPLPSELEIRTAAAEARWGTSHDATPTAA